MLAATVYGPLPSDPTPQATTVAVPTAGAGADDAAGAGATAVRTAPLIDRTALLFLVGMVGAAIVLTQVTLDVEVN